MKGISIYNSYGDNERKREILIEKIKQRGFYPSKKGEYLVIIGGDGTFLSAVRKRFKNNPIFVGVNAGSLGFFAEYTMETINQMLTTIQKGDYWIEEYPVFEVKMFGEENITEYFINELVIERKDTGVTAISLHADDRHLVTAPADSIIISAKAGSTAYNMVIGGAISFSSDVYQVIYNNPIINKQYQERPYPFVFSNQTSLTIFPSVQKKRGFRAVRDGQMIKGKEFDYAEVRKTPFVVQVLRSNQYNRIDVVRNNFISFGGTT